MNIIQQHLGKLITAGVIGVMAIVMVSSYYGAYNYGADMETLIPAQYSDMESNLGQYSLKVSEAAQVPGMYKDDLKEVMTSVMTARQGEGGSKAAFQWFKEHNIDIDAAMYTKIQQIIESGRNKFANLQTKFIDTKRGYEATLKKDLFLTRGWWLSVANYPKIDLAEYAIISSEHAKDTFKTKVDTGMKLRN